LWNSAPPNSSCIHERERIEHQHALEAERSRIARDLHDDLGSSLTEISALASTGLRRDDVAAPTQAGQSRQPDDVSHSTLFHTIIGKARRLVAALDVIVWAVDLEDNSLQSLADYLTGYAGEFFAHTNISCRFKVPVSLPRIQLEGRIRHDLLMAVKEALNNIVRHSEATEVEFCLSISEGDLEVEILDNGKGIGDPTEKDGHGLKNLASRLRELGGTCVVEPRAGGGTGVRMRLPLEASAASAAQPVQSA
jgi:signal transduction histidine kinase